MSNTIKKIVEIGLKDLISSFNSDPFFIKANISFSRNCKHLIDRLFERKIDELEMIQLLKSVVDKHKCEIVYVCYLDDPPIRVNIKDKNLVIGLTLHVDEEGVKRLRLRTIIKNFEKRNDSRISTFVLTG